MIGYDFTTTPNSFSDSTFFKYLPFILTFSFLSFSGSDARFCHAVTNMTGFGGVCGHMIFLAPG